MTDPNLVPCSDPGPTKDVNVDRPPPYCSEAIADSEGQLIKQSQKEVPGRDSVWFQEKTQKKTGVGQSANCDPMQTGHIINEQDGVTDRNVVYRYTQAIRGCDEAMKDLFSDIIVIDEMGKAHNVPIIHATQEKAVAAIIQSNVRKNDSLVVDRTRLPMLAIHSTGLEYDKSRYIYHKAIDYVRDFKQGGIPGMVMQENKPRDTVFGVARGIPINISYTLYIWTLYREDINQIIEQVLLKFSPLAYIRVSGVSWEIGVELDDVRSNIEDSPGDQAVVVYKYEVQMTAQSFIPQPIVRKDAVLKTRIDLVNSLKEDEITDVIARLEEAVKEI